MGAMLNGQPRRTVRSRRGSSIIAQAIAILTRYGGSLWVADPAYVFTGSDGSGAASDGSDTGYVRDLCGNARPLTQATTAAKPKLRLLSGRWGFVFDGTDDLLATAAIAAASSETMVVAKLLDALPGTAAAAISKTGTNLGALLYSSSTSTTFMRIGTGSAFTYVTPTTAAGVAVVQSGVFAGSYRQRRNGIQVSSGTVAYASATAILQVGGAAGQYGSQKIFAAAYAPAAIPDAELLIVERAMGALAGVTI